MNKPIIGLDESGGEGPKITWKFLVWGYFHPKQHWYDHEGGGGGGTENNPLMRETVSSVLFCDCNMFWITDSNASHLPETRRAWQI